MIKYVKKNILKLLLLVAGMFLFILAFYNASNNQPSINNSNKSSESVDFVDIIPKNNQPQPEAVADPIQNYDRLSLNIKWGVIEDIKDNYILMRFYDNKTDNNDKSDDRNDIAHDNTNDAEHDKVNNTKSYTKKVFYNQNTIVEIEYVPKNYPYKKLYTPKIVRSNNITDLKSSNEITIEFVGNFEDREDLTAEIIHTVFKIPAEEFDKI